MFFIVNHLFNESDQWLKVNSLDDNNSDHSTIHEIIDNNGETLNLCSLVCMYLDHDESADNESLIIIRVWDGSTSGTTANLDPIIVKYALQCAVEYAKGRSDDEVLNICQNESPANNSTTTELIGHPLMVFMDGSIFESHFMDLLPGTWIRVRHLHFSDGMASFEEDTQVCALRPYFWYG